LSCLGITERECKIIGGCWTKSSYDIYCAYPLHTNGSVTVPSNNHNLNHQLPAHDIFGVPSCSSFNSARGLLNSSDGTLTYFSNEHLAHRFISDYHQCLSSGCAIDVDRAYLFDVLKQTSFSMRYPFRQQFIEMIFSGEVRPDNYMEIINQFELQYKWQPSQPFFPYSSGIFNQYTPFPSIPFLPYGSAPVPFRLPIVFPSITPAPPTDQQSCPFLNLVQNPNLPRLTGRTDGCCDRPICFLPKSALRSPKSGVASYLSQWSAWGKCSKESNSGVQNRTRVCVGKNCKSDEVLIQFQACNVEDNCIGVWGAWNPCSLTCGGGIRTRSRFYRGLGDCPVDQGPPIESGHCATEECPTFVYGNWTSCSSTCGRGIKSRTIHCISPGDFSCPKDEEETQVCENFCGTSSLQCNTTTCVYEQICLQQDGSPGYCERHNDTFTVGEPCLEEHCLIRDDRRHI